MKNTLVVVADLACYKAYRLEASHLNRTPRLELLEEFDSPEAHGKIVDRVSDLAGQFRRGKGDGSDGEQHNMELEKRKRLVRQLTDTVNRLAGKAEIEKCHLAISREMNNQVVEGLTPGVRAKIGKNLRADLTKADKTELLKHFEVVLVSQGTRVATAPAARA